MWNTIEEQVSYEFIDMLMTKIIFSSSGTFSLIKSNMESSLVNEKYKSIISNNFNVVKKRTRMLSEF